MIVQWLKEIIESYFQNGPENRVFLFFDPSGDYASIMDYLRGDFNVVKGDGSLLKIKYQIECEEPDKKFVVYLPFSKDSKKLSYLKEYLYTGKVFSNTLYAFLKSKNVKFPTERRKITDIKKILPSLAIESIGKGEEYWETVFDKSGEELVLPDFREKLLQFLESPEETYQLLKNEKQIDAFIKKMGSEYGFKEDIENPEKYRDNFFRQLCFTEVYQVLKKPESFSFKDFVSNEDKIDNNIKLIQEIRSHNRYRETYYDQTIQLERNYNIRDFARTYSLTPDLETFKVFHLEALKELNRLALECETKNEFVALISKNTGLINKKSSGFWANAGYIQEWFQLSTLSKMIELIECFKEELQDINDEQLLVKRYYEKYFKIDQLYRKYKTDSYEIEDSLEDIYDWIEKFYIEYLDKLNSPFSEKIFEKEKWELKELPFQGDFLKKLDLKNNPKTGIIIVDGLRFELGKEIARRISTEFEVDIKPMYTQIPTETAVGMASLLSPEKYELDCDSSGIRISSKGVPLNDKAQRIKYLKSTIEKLTDFNVEDFNEMSAKDLQKIKNPIVIFSGDPDTLGEAGGINYLRYISQSLDGIIKAVKKLSRAGFSKAHITSDHGFLTFRDQESNFKIGDKPGFIKDSRRFACGENLESENLVKLNVPNMGKSLYFPRSIYYFKKDSFLHGGISIQETIIPHITITSKKDEAEKVNIQIETERGISNRIFEVKVRPKWTGIEGKPRTVEVLAYYNDELISSRPATEIESKEESLMIRIIPSKNIPQGENIRIIARDQETGEILDETEKEAMITFEPEDL